MIEDDAHWYEDMVRGGWQMPVVPRWKTLPVIRHIRAWYHMWKVNRHYRAMRATGLGMLDTGYDSWVLYGMWHGREGLRAACVEPDEGRRAGGGWGSGRS